MGFVWLIPGLPLLGAVVNGLLGRRLPRRFVEWFAVGVMGAAFVLALLAFGYLIALPEDARVIHETLYSWIAVGDFEVNVALLLDPLSMIMILVVTGVGTLIH